MLIIARRRAAEHRPVHPAAAGGFKTGGGFGNAMVGTLVMVGIASLISIPIGMLAAVYLSDIGPNSRLTAAARFLSKVLTGFPSILAGVFGFAILVLTSAPTRRSPAAWRWPC